MILVRLGDTAGSGVGAAILDCDCELVRWGVMKESTPPAPDVGTATGPTTSTSIVPSIPFSRAAALDSCAGTSGPSTPGRSSYKIGENLTATLAFLCPGSCATGERAKFAREYMYTDDVDGGGIRGAGVGVARSVVTTDGRPLLPRTGVPFSSLLLLLLDVPGMTEGSSNWQAGVMRSPPSGLKVSRRKKLVKLSSP